MDPWDITTLGMGGWIPSGAGMSWDATLGTQGIPEIPLWGGDATLGMEYPRDVLGASREVGLS